MFLYLLSEAAEDIAKNVSCIKNITTYYATSAVDVVENGECKSSPLNVSRIKPSRVKIKRDKTLRMDHLFSLGGRGRGGGHFDCGRLESHSKCLCINICRYIFFFFFFLIKSELHYIRV